MKKLIIPFLLLGILGGEAQAQGKKGAKPSTAPKTESAPASLAIGSEIPDQGIVLVGVDQKPVSLMQAKTEKGLLVMFSCNTCPFVIKAQPRTLSAMQNARKLGVGMVIINSNQGQRDSLDSRNAMLRYSAEQQYSVPYVIDEMSRVADAFGATRTPEVFLFDGEGKLVYKGAMEDNPADPSKSTKTYLDDALKALVSNAAISPKETKSIGCSIKRAEM